MLPFQEKKLLQKAATPLLSILFDKHKVFSCLDEITPPPMNLGTIRIQHEYGVTQFALCISITQFDSKGVQNVSMAGLDHRDAEHYASFP